MGVFARLFRRSRATEETRTAESRADGPASGPGSEETAGTTEPKGSAGAPETAEPPAAEGGQATAADTVDIPKQQSAESGSEAGEGART
ncbi:hypothetical protein ACIRPR_32365 [Streptomyces griseoflavus]|uniref:hypothetical protein n=1 Tax=Streptomyces griseoflavus TaxID=35619 RepID=UPI00382CC6B0